MTSPDRTVLAIGGAVVAIVIAAVIVVLALGEPSVAEYDPDSPEGTVQRYLRAAYAGDDETALELLSERARNEVEDREFGRLFCEQSEGHLVRIDDVEINEARATVRLTVEDVSGSALDFDRYEWERSVLLVRENDSWKIDEPYFCV